MAKRFKLKLSRIFPSFRFCRSKHPSTFPHNPLPANYRLSPVNPKVLDIAFSSGREINTRSSVNSWTDSKPRRKAHSESDFPSESDSRRSLKINGKKKTKTSKELKPSALSGISSNDWFSDEEESQEIKTLISSFVTDSSFEFSSPTDQPVETMTEKWITKSDDLRKWSTRNHELSGEFVPITATEGGKVKESFAVVKKSKDPYKDFKRSMMQMILEKEMFEAEELEQLLMCFLSLNSRSHHTVIVEAFSEIWELLFRSQSHLEIE